MNVPTFDTGDRRRFFRIQDDVALRYRTVTSEELDAALQRIHLGYPDTISLASAFASSSAQMRQALERVRSESPDVAALLEGLNEKLDMLIQLMAVHDAELDNHPTHGVSLSASGISFQADTALDVGALVEIKLVLFPQYVCMLCFGPVVHCHRCVARDGTKKYDIGVDFTHIRENDRELIVQHITRKQSAQLREARKALDANTLPPED